jgi:hypothetical protein
MGSVVSRLGKAPPFPPAAVKMKAPMETSKYTAEQISEIANRIATLRKRWLCSVANQIASKQKSKTSARPVEEGEAAS